MVQYRKKPVVIEAFEWTGDREQKDDPVWITEAIEKGRVYFINPGTEKVIMAIETLEGTMHGSRGDYIIKGIQGEIYPCKADIFEATYEEV